MLFLSLLFAFDAPFSIPELKKLGNEIGQSAHKKTIEILKKHPEYRKYFWRPAKKPFKISKKNLKLMEPETLNVLVLRVQFLLDDSTDPLDSLTTGNGKMQYTPQGHPCDTVVDSTTGDTSYTRSLYYDPPHDSLYFHHLMEYLHNYYWEVSHHLLYIKYKIYPEGAETAYTVPHKASYYGNPNMWTFGLFSILKDAIQVADQDPVNIDFSDFDRVILFHAGSMWQTDVAGNTPYDLPAVYIEGADEIFGEPIYANNRTDSINSGVIYAETAFQDGYPAFLQGGLCHEFGHTLGFLDLYDVSGESMGMGGWAIMGTGNWNMDGLVPPRASGWHRLLVGFDDTLVINHDTTGVKIHWTGSSNTPRLIKIPINAHEYFLIENRYTYMNSDTVRDFDPCQSCGVDSNGFRVWKDNVLTKVNDYEVSLPPDPNSGGLAIYHIDDNKIARDDTFNMINAGYPKGVAMEEADGIQDFQRPFSEGIYSNKELWETFYGSPYDVFSSYGRLDSFTESSRPNTDDNDSGKTYIAITNISHPGEIMHFDVHFRNRITGFPVYVDHPSDVISPMPVHIGDSLYILQGTYYGDLFLISPDGERPYFGKIDNNTYSTPAIGDLDGNGTDEVASADLNGIVYAWELDSTHQKLAEYQTNGPIYGSPSIADIDNDGKAEILVGTDDNYLYALSLPDTGTHRTLVAKPGFPVYLGQSIWSVPLFYKGYIYALTADGTVYKISPTGKIIWRRGKENLAFTTSSPVIGDIDRDGTDEIMYITGGGKVWCISTKDSVSDSIKWVYQMQDTTFVSSPALGDIDGDGYPDIVFAGKDKIYALNKNGVLLDNFPVDMKFGDWIQSSIVLADLNDDGKEDIIFGSPVAGVHILNYQGKDIDLSPISTGATVWATPLIYDLNNDSNTTEILFGAEDSMIYGYKFISKIKSNWQMEFKNPAHQMIYSDSLLPPSQTPDTLFYHRKFYIYPSPITKNSATIRYYLGDKAKSVKIKIFNIAGDLIKDMDGTTENGDNDNSVDFTNIANGVYILTINVKFTNGKIIQDKKRFAIMKGGF